MVGRWRRRRGRGRGGGGGGTGWTWKETEERKPEIRKDKRIQEQQQQQEEQEGTSASEISGGSEIIWKAIEGKVSVARYGQKARERRREARRAPLYHHHHHFHYHYPKYPGKGKQPPNKTAFKRYTLQCDRPMYMIVVYHTTAFIQFYLKEDLILMFELVV